MKQTFSNKQKLKSQKQIDELFEGGKSLTVYPLKLVYLFAGNSNKIGVSVGKKNFKRAIDRNRIKRLLREAYRHNKKMLIDNKVTGYAFMILYLGKTIPDYKLVNSKIKTLLAKFLDSLSEL